MSYRIAGIDVHKKMLAVVVADVEIEQRTTLAHLEQSQGASSVLAGLDRRRPAVLAGKPLILLQKASTQNGLKSIRIVE
jgi:hypothetical protein